MRPYELDIDLDNVDADGIAQSQTPSSAGNLTLNGALGTTLDYARIIIITSAADDSGRTFTITGTDADGKAITDAVTGANAGVAVSAKFFKTITSIAVDAATAGAVTVGTRNSTSVALSKTVPINFYAPEAATVSVDVTGTISFTVQETFDDILGQSPTLATWYDVTALAAKSADTTSKISANATAVRVKINSYTDTAELQARIIQSMYR
jgi:hypothetical protein